MTTHTGKKATGDNNVAFVYEPKCVLKWKNNVKAAVEEQDGDCKGRLCGHW